VTSVADELDAAPSQPLKYRRVLLKISGEALAGDKPGGLGFDFPTIEKFADEIQLVGQIGAEIGLVIGGGNIVRGRQLAEHGFDRVGADYMMEELAEPYIRRRALRHLEQGRIVIFAAGTGNPYFSTDTAAVLRAIQTKADVIIKATSVDGIYSKDPKKFKDATLYRSLSYNDVIRLELSVMDQTAITLCKENRLPLIVLNINTPHSVARALRGDIDGTIVDS
jgi:uridylate kinase